MSFIKLSIDRLAQICRAGAHTPLRVVSTLLVLFYPFLMGAFVDQGGDGLSTPMRYTLAVSVYVILVFSFDTAPIVGAIGVAGYVAFMGGIRRSLIPYIGYVNNDPITVISFMVSLTVFLKLVLSRKIVTATRIEKLVLTMTLILVFEILNPLQGGIAVGLGGAFYYLTPLFWFYIGSLKCNLAGLDTFYKSIIFFIFCSGCVGLYQTIFGLSELERYWVIVSNATQYMTAKTTRIFGLAPSFSEYASLLGVIAVICWSKFLSRKYYFGILWLFFFFLAFLSSSRGVVFSVFTAMVVLWAIQSSNYRAWIPRLILATVVGFAGLIFGAQQATSIAFNNDSSTMIQHQVTGLSDPFGKKSTGGSHLGLIGEGILSGLKNPIGYGTGATTAAAGKFGGETVAGTEFDVSNIFVSTGFIGGIVYSVLGILFWIQFARYWHDTKDPMALTLIGLMTVSIGQWMSGGHYLPTMILWFSFGVMNKIVAEHEKKKAVLAATAKPEMVAV